MGIFLHVIPVRIIVPWLDRLSEIRNSRKIMENDSLDLNVSIKDSEELFSCNF